MNSNTDVMYIHVCHVSCSVVVLFTCTLAVMGKILLIRYPVFIVTVPLKLLVTDILNVMK
jgi:hypothetical protein